LPIPQKAKSFFFCSGLVHGSYRIKMGLGIENRSCRIVAHRRFDRGRTLAARDDDDICPLQRRAWLSQASRRKQMPAPKGICGVDENDIHVASQLPMLKSIIQNEPLHAAANQFPAF
jgi:hypothetical protein